MDLSAKPLRDPDVVDRAIDDMFVIVDPKTSDVHNLNVVGRRIWELSDGSRTVEAIADALADEFEVSPETARDDVVAFVDELRGKGLLGV